MGCQWRWYCWRNIWRRLPDSEVSDWSWASQSQLFQPLHQHNCFSHHHFYSHCRDNLLSLQRLSFYTLITTNTLGKFCWQSWGCRCWPGCRGWGWPGWATPSRRPRSSWGSAPSPGATIGLAHHEHLNQGLYLSAVEEVIVIRRSGVFVEAGQVQVFQVLAPVCMFGIGSGQEYWFWHDISPWWKIKPGGSILKPEEAVDDALVCVWQRVVPLITSRDA